MAGHVFISYARSDQAYVNALKNALRQRGYEPWNDEHVGVGERWWPTIVQAIRDSSAFIVVMTPASEESEWVEKEILLALDEKKYIFPLLLLRGRRFPLLINRRYEDVTSHQLPSNEFYKTLGRFVPVSVSPKPKIPPTADKDKLETKKLHNAYVNVERAIEFYKQELDRTHRSGDRRGEGIQLGNLGRAYHGMGQVKRARQYLTQALAIFEEIKSPDAERVRDLLATLEKGGSS